ncbi:MAG: glycosyltransferase [Thermoplasmata archaeon]
MIFLLHGVTIEPISIANPVGSLFSLFVESTWRMAGRESLLASHLFQVLNPPTRRLLLRCGVKSQQIQVVDLGIDYGRYRTSRNDSTFRIVYLGRLNNRQKGAARLSRLAEFVSKLDSEDIRMEIIGSGESAAHFNRMRLKNVSYLGFVREEEKCSSLATANLMISLSYVEPFSFSVVEGLASGLPVVSTSVSGPQSIVGRDKSFGKLTTMRDRDLIAAILAYYDRWKGDKEEYYLGKLRRRADSERFFNQESMFLHFRDLVNSAGSGSIELASPPLEGSEFRTKYLERKQGGENQP